MTPAPQEPKRHDYQATLTMWERKGWIMGKDDEIIISALTRCAAEPVDAEASLSPDVLERVARAICNSAQDDVYHHLPLNSIERALYQQQARDAILAMKEGA
jgi:hypothetical protein